MNDKLIIDTCSLEIRYIPLYVGLTTGLCGSITSFSSWMADVFQAFAQIGKPSHGGFYNVCPDNSLACFGTRRD